MDVGELCRQVAAQARQLDKRITTYEFFPQSISEPAWVVIDVNCQYDRSYNRGLDQLTIIAGYLVSKADDRSASDHLYTAIAGDGDGSVKEVLERNPTLNDNCDDLVVTRGRIPRVIKIGETDYLGAEFTIAIDGPGE